MADVVGPDGEVFLIGVEDITATSAPRRELRAQKYALDLRFFDIHSGDTVAKLYAGKSLKKCGKHRAQPWHWACPRCRALTLAKPDIRFDLTGYGCAIGALPALMDAALRPIVGDSVAHLLRVDLAVDVELPFQHVLPIYSPSRSDARRRYRKATKYIPDLSTPNKYLDLSAPSLTMLRWGRRHDGIVAYDKTGLLSLKDPLHFVRAPEAPELTRFEIRVSSPKADTPMSFEYAEAELLRRAHSIRFADLRHAELDLYDQILVGLARISGVIDASFDPGRVSPTELRKRRDTLGHHAHDYLRALARLGGAQWRTATQDADAALARVLKIARELEAKNDFTVGEVVAERLPDLMAELRRAVGNGGSNA